MSRTLPSFVRTMGDPHLGKRFFSNVPLHRRGEREALVFDQFERELLDCNGIVLHVCMGDLFDKFQVPASVVLRTYHAYQKASLANPDTIYVVLRGNHDASRDASQNSSFDLFEALCVGLSNVKVVSNAPEFVLNLHDENFVFLPWHPFHTAQEIAQQANLDDTLGQYFVFGHWDVIDFGDGSNDNMVPYAELEGAALIVTGHYHIAKTFEHDGLTVTVTGSMQPYSHAEDVSGDWYLTEKLSVVLENLEADSEYYRNKNLRVVLGADDGVLEEVECLSLSFLREDEIEAELSVDIDNFNLANLFSETFDEFQVTPELKTKLWNQFKEVSHD